MWRLLPICAVFLATTGFCDLQLRVPYVVAARQSGIKGPLDARCSGQKVLSTQLDVEALALLGCRRLTWLEVTGGVSSLAPLARVVHEVHRLDIHSCWQLRSLQGLSALANVTGSFYVQHNEGLLSLDGIENLVYAKTLHVLVNRKLRSIFGLRGLRRVGGDITIFGNAELTSLRGLSNLTEIEESLTISNLNDLRSLTGLDNIKRIVADLKISGNPMLHTLRGLDSLSYLGGKFILADNRELMSFQGLSSLQEAGPSFTVENNAKLKSFNGLDQLRSVWGPILIRKNNALRSLQGLEHLSRASSVSILDSGPLWVLGGPFSAAPPNAHIRALYIDRASWPQCVTPQEREALRSAGFVRDATLSFFPKATWERWRNFGCGPGLVSCTRGTPCTVDLSSSKLQGARSVFLSASDRTCGACNKSLLQAKVQHGQVADITMLVRTSQPGNFSICRCLSQLVGSGPVAQLSVWGPSSGHKVKCFIGGHCPLQLPMRHDAKDELQLKDKCDGPQLPGAVAVRAEDGFYHFPNRSVLAAVMPNTYELCWRPPCQGHGCELVQVGKLTLLGPFDLGEKRIPLGYNLTLRNVGMGVKRGDRLRIQKSCGPARLQEQGRGQADTGLGADQPILEAESDAGLAFRFGLVLAGSVWPGANRMCWCHPDENISACSGNDDFLVDIGEMLVLCPRGQEAREDGLCHECDVGMQKWNIFAESCEADRVWWVWFCIYCICLYLAAVIPSLVLIGRIKVEDVSLEGDKTVITTVRPHGLHMYAKSSFCVRLSGTAHPELEDPGLCYENSLAQVSSSWSSASCSSSTSSCCTLQGPRNAWYVAWRLFAWWPERLTLSFVGVANRADYFRARVLSNTSLELLTKDRQPLDRRLDTSMGVVSLAVCSRLAHSCWPLPATLAPQPLLLLALTIGSIEVKPEWSAKGLALSLLAALGTAVVWLSIRRIWPQKPSLERRLDSFRKKLLKHNPSPQPCPRGPLRAIEIGKVLDILEFFDPFIRDRPAYYMDGNIFQPLARPHRLSYAELAGPVQVEWFVSHYWGTPFRHFCHSVRKHAESICRSARRDWRSVAYWICFCSNNQFELDRELGDSWEESSFYKTLQSGMCKGTCMVLDDDAKPFTRSWCIFELLQTLQLESRTPGFGGLLLCTAGGVLNFGQGSVEVAINLVRRIAVLDLAQAEASDQRDKDMINNQVIRELGSFDALVRFVRQKMRLVLEGAQGHANSKFTQLFALIDSQESGVSNGEHAA